MAPIPPATISFHGTAIVHPADSPAARSLPEELASLSPPERRASTCIVEVIPEGTFLTYGLGVPLLWMRDPAAFRGHAPVAWAEGGPAASDDGKEVTPWPRHAAWSG